MKEMLWEFLLIKLQPGPALLPVQCPESDDTHSWPDSFHTTDLRFFKSCTEVTFVEFTWSFTHPQEKSIGVTSGDLGGHAMDLPLPIHPSGKVLSRNFQTIKSQCGWVPSFRI
jgi:hypothetical protein